MVNIGTNAHEILPNLWLGNRHAALNKEWLEQTNIKAVFNCSKDIPFASGQRHFYRIPIDDNLEQEEIRNLELWSWETVYKLRKELSEGNPVLVHCAAGMQRSAAVVAMFCISQFRCQTDEAVTFIKSRRPVAFLGNVNFYKAIKGFETSLFRFIQERKIYDKMPRLPMPI